MCNTAARSDVKMAINRSKIHKLPKDFDMLGTSAKLNTMGNAQIPQYKMNRFPQNRVTVHCHDGNTSALSKLRLCYPSLLQLL